MKIVGFITPENEFISMKYEEVEEFCKEICLREENKESFKMFSNDYKYFTPYFDWVMVNKKYLFVNPLLLSRKCQTL